MLENYLDLAIKSIFIENMALAFFLGMCSFVAVSRKVEAQIGSTETRTIIDGTLEFRRSLNAGAVFGSFSGRASLFVIASLLALGFVLYLFTRSSPRQYGLHATGLLSSRWLGVRAHQRPIRRNCQRSCVKGKTSDVARGGREGGGSAG